MGFFAITPLAALAIASGGWLQDLVSISLWICATIALTTD